MNNSKDFYFNLIVGTGVSLLSLMGAYTLTHVMFDGKGYIANVSGRNITISEFKEKFGGMKKQQTTMGTDFKTEAGKAQYFELRNQVFNDIILTKVLLAEADNQKIEFTPQQVDEEIQKVKATTFKNNEEAFQKAMKKNNFTIEKLREVVKERTLVKKVIDKLIEDGVKISEKDLIDYYNSKKESEFVTKEMVEASHILVKEEAKAKEIIDELDKGGNFDELAKKYSTDPGSKNTGGKLGFFAKSDMVKEFADAAWELSDGEITSKAVKSQFGFHIIKRTGHKPSEVTPFEKVKEKISADVKNSKQTEFFQKWKEKTLKDTEIKPNVGYEDFVSKTKEDVKTVNPNESKAPEAKDAPKEAEKPKVEEKKEEKK